jgi:DNA-binding IclR family transcriptional regulator
MPASEIDAQNRNPAIERMMAILQQLERAPNGLGLKRLVAQSGVTRSTVYRILNSLTAHGLVRQLENSDYVLGSRLLSLADNVGMPSGGRVAKAAQPHLDFVARSLGETSKISIYDRGHVLVIAVAGGTKQHALHARVGEQLPIHAGGSSKALFAFLPEAERQRIYSRPLTQYNERTIFEPEAIEEELSRVRQQGQFLRRADPGSVGRRCRRPQHPFPRRPRCRVRATGPRHGARHRRPHRHGTRLRARIRPADQAGVMV